jgi:hypothetical protein
VEVGRFGGALLVASRRPNASRLRLFAAFARGLGPKVGLRSAHPSTVAVYDGWVSGVEWVADVYA